MRSLFLKIFFYFLLIILLVATTVVVLTYFRDQEFPPLAHQNFARRAIAEYGREAIRAYEHEGVAEVDEFTAKLLDESSILLVLFDQNARPLTGRMVPRRMQHMAMRAMRSGEVVFPMRGSRNGLAGAIQSQSGNHYIVALSLPEQPPSRHLFQGLMHGFLGGQLLILLTVTAVVCYFLARSLTSPIGRLRQATRRFAAGDLTTRIGNQVKGKNELAGLAQDFDEMAGKIETLVGTQKRLLRDISHELRSPLARLGIALELVRQQGNPEAQDKALKRIELESERMNEMIGQLLSLNRMESGSSELRLCDFDICELLAGLVQDANYEAEARQCEVLFEAPEAVFFRGSEELLAQALENVIRNAVKYTADHSRVVVKLWTEKDALVIQVTDQGPGVPVTALDKMFEPFYRVADARDRQSGGTGIGLAIAERAVILHKGTIAASNPTEGGLLVEIRLPLNI